MSPRFYVRGRVGLSKSYFADQDRCPVPPPHQMSEISGSKLHFASRLDRLLSESIARGSHSSFQ